MFAAMYTFILVCVVSWLACRKKTASSSECCCWCVVATGKLETSVTCSQTLTAEWQRRDRTDLFHSSERTTSSAESPTYAHSLFLSLSISLLSFFRVWPRHPHGLYCFGRIVVLFRTKCTFRPWNRCDALTRRQSHYSTGNIVVHNLLFNFAA